MVKEYETQDEADYQALMGQQGADPSQDPNALYADTMREEKITNVIAQINPDNMLSDVENRIRGYKKNNMTNQWEKINPDSDEVHPELIANFMSFLSSILNQNTSMSNFSSSEINSIMENVIDYIGDDLTVNDEKYGVIGNYQEMSRIGNIICMMIFAVLKRSQNGMEARRIFGSLKISETLTQAPQNKGFVENMKFWK